MKYFITSLLFMCQLMLFCQSYQDYNPNDERFKVIALKKAKIRMENSEKGYNKAKGLFSKKMISEQQLDNYQVEYENCKLNYQQYYLSVIFDKPHLSVLSAVKTKDAQGNIRVKLNIQNTSGGTFGLEEIAMDNGKHDESSAGNMKLSPSSMNNIYISLKDDDGSIISQPYEYHLAKLNISESADISFELLKDVEALTVSANYGDKYDNKKIFLKRENRAKSITVTPDIYAQETESGRQAMYKLNMEYYGNGRSRYRLKLEGLPPYFNYEFINARTNSVISNITFSEKNYQQDFQLKISVPEKNGANIKLDKSLVFQVLLYAENGKVAGKTELELTPSGKASLEFTMNNMFFSVEKGERISIYPLHVNNDGLKDLADLDFEIILPPGWEYTLNPEKINVLAVDKELKLKLDVIPATDVLPGIYQLKIKGSARAGNRMIHTSPREVKVEIKSKSNPLLVISMIMAALLLVAVVIYVIVRVTRN